MHKYYMHVMKGLISELNLNLNELLDGSLSHIYYSIK